MRRVVAGDFQIVEDRVGGDGFGDDVARALPARVRADVVADQNDYAAAVRRRAEEILGGDEDAVVDIGGAARLECADLLGDFAFCRS